ncbi:nitronate monooxygenase [Sphingomonas sp. LY54]|uniref:NAD(P)H-dependent flavin oxidoreductase n=1 Tax=Sphingomonas sp. LY54 TaxID=3095343 RepID=UPI002D77C94D|nr:nitronate monooxygenase [Sphingomonas sp. LY54]WRP29374.1 nitronate monooxygenase [Sphingomonas sp. LY54]
MNPLQQLGVILPIVQAPMAGVSTPELAASVCNAGALGSIGVGATDATGARAMIDETRARTDGAFNVNVFVHATARADAARERHWLEAMQPLFLRYGAEPPSTLRTIYTSFGDDDDMLALLVETAPPVVSFHFGLPSADRIAALKQAGCTLLASATSLAEARLVEAAGIDMVVAQGWEAGGHRGVFDPAGDDDQLGTMALTRLLATQTSLPVIAAGGIMDGAGIRAALRLGAVAAQLGTAFIACPESSADESYRAALVSESSHHTTMTGVISGRPARCLANHFTRWGAECTLPAPDYPIAYDAGKALHAAAKAAGEYGFGAHWAGQGAPLHRPMPAGTLVELLWRETSSTHD